MDNKITLHSQLIRYAEFFSNAREELITVLSEQLQQSQLFGLSEKLRGIQDVMTEPFLSLTKIQCEILSTKSMQAFYDRIQDALFPIYEPIGIQNLINIDNLRIPLLTSFERLFSSSLVEESIARIRQDITSLCSSIHDITVHDAYVFVPESLISATPVTHDIESPSAKTGESHNPMRKISIVDAVSLILTLISLLIAIHSCIQGNTDSLQQEKIIKTLEQQNTLQEEQIGLYQQQLDAIEEQTQYLISIYNTLRDSQSPPHTESGSAPEGVPAEPVFPHIDSTQEDTDSLSDVPDDSGAHSLLE